MGELRNYLKIVGIIFIFALFTYFTSFAEKKNLPQKKKISVDYIYKIYKQGNCFFVDARSFEEYAKGHIEGAINIPFHSEKKDDYIVKAIDILNGAKYVVVYCDGSECGLSKMLAKDLLNAGLKKEKLIIFTEGFDAWQKKNYPISKDLSFQKALFSQ
ncbi:rhodanese domain protein [Thermotomaculum hydrothermale]|uniref:Rhodanese domain protein n=1 Tax=Thermotomaculum hydrothermale TaxID=981385 RepID=A0A7R6SYU6_9BACT|nr:rhodanese-like domain-containing protein [Thermotomaculum hydrothermale]BBB33164.1 rhodanese domain protein [Thermotomaculum hydrothermale]